MNNMIDLDIKKILNKKSLMHSYFPSMGKIIKKIHSSKTIHLVYGETYDLFGLTIDSLKYYFCLSLLHQELEQKGYLVKSYIIVGDLHSVKNKLVVNKDILLSLSQERISDYQKIKTIYGLKSDVILMSSIMVGEQYKKNYEKVKSTFTNSKKIQKIVEKTVLNNRLAQEKEIGFQYAIEEIALIMDFDIKIGPPREKYYDKVAHYIKENERLDGLTGIYFKPTYPLGFNFDYFVCHEEIDRFGLTPYKAGSNKLQNHRIIIGVTTLDEIERLINSSYIPENPVLPNPVLDIFTISNMAKALLTGTTYSDDKEQKLVKNPDMLQEMSVEYLKKYILLPLGFLHS
jgi:hypothetical protein